MTTTTIARGCAWCSTCLHTGEDDFPGVADRIRALFAQYAEEAGHPEVTWFPGTSEVWGDANQEYDEDEVDSWRDRAETEALAEYAE